MDLTKVELDKEKLLSLTVPERTFFLALGHLSNELNASPKLLYWAANAPLDHEVHEAGQYSLMLMLIQLLAGKLNEGWRLFENFFFGSKLSIIYHPLLDDESSEALNNLRRYFGSTNSANIIRNTFSFHYSPEQVSDFLPHVEKELIAYMNSEAAPNNLFQFSETVLSDVLLNCLAERGITQL